MKYVVLDKFTNFLSVDENGNTLEFNLLKKLIMKLQIVKMVQLFHQIQINFLLKLKVLDVLVSFAQSMYPEEFNSSEELTPEDFMDAPL